MTLTTSTAFADQLTAIDDLRDGLNGSLLVTLDDRTGVTRTLSNPVGYVTGTNAGVPVDVATSFVQSNLSLLGLYAGDIAEMEVCDVVFSQVSGATHVYFCQIQSLGVEDPELA